MKSALDQAAVLVHLRSLMADKEAIVQNMVRENALGGWMADWNKALQAVDAEAANYFALLECRIKEATKT